MFNSNVRTTVAKAARKMVENSAAKRLIDKCSNETWKSSVRCLGTTTSSYTNANLSGVSQRNLSSLALDDNDYSIRPSGELFDLKRGESIDESIVGKTAKIRRVFGPRANAHGLLACGGEELARHASFDPDYSRARGWIQNRAIGDAVLSPVLISGLVGALVEAAFPQSVPVMASMHHARPLIVGQEVNATIQVTSVKHFTRQSTEVSIKEKDFGSRHEGHEIRLVTEVVRAQDNEVIAEGSHSIWIPGYLAR
jgi:acyl dehydratase